MKKKCLSLTLCNVKGIGKKEREEGEKSLRWKEWTLRRGKREEREGGGREGGV